MATTTEYYKSWDGAKDSFIEAVYTQNNAAQWTLSTTIVVNTATDQRGQSRFTGRIAQALPVRQFDIAATGRRTNSQASPSSTATPTPPVCPGCPGLQGGPVAGIAIGCIIAGALIAFVIAALLYRRKRQTAPEYEKASAKPKHAGPSPLSSVAPSPQDRLQLSQFLLDTTPDKDISGELSSLDQLIQNHVENHYHLQPVHANPAALTQALANLGFDWASSATSVDSIVALALDPRTRQAAIRHVVSFICFSSVGFSARSRLSMLPPPVAAFLQSVPAIDRHRVNAEAASTALSRWRTISAFLLHAQRADRTPLVPSDHAVLPQAAGLANAMMSFLQPFVLSGRSAAQAQGEHLQAVILECTKLGYVLFSQPADWRFTHAAPVQPGVHFLVVCAGLLKVGDKDGRHYNAPQQVAAPALVQV